jgi:hypothetical protein
MHRARRSAIGFVWIVWGAVLFGGLLAAHEGDASAAVRRATQRRTASTHAPPGSKDENATTDRASDAPSAPRNGATSRGAPDVAAPSNPTASSRTANKAATSGATVTAAPAASGRRARARRSSANRNERKAERSPSARAIDKGAPPDKTPTDKAPPDKTPTDQPSADKAVANQALRARPLIDKPLADKSSTDKSSTDKSLGAKLGDGTLRNADLRPGAAKAPSDLSPSGKSMTEQFGGDTAPTDASESSGARPVGEVTNGRRDVSRDAPSSATLAPSGRPVTLTLEGPVFDGGDVPRAAAALERMRANFAKCVPNDAALTKNEATIDLRFLVRAPGRAEGVDVEKARGVSGDVVKCMTSLLARSYIGAPSDDPVGVGVTVRVRKD